MFKVQGAPQDRLELLRQFMEDCQNLLQRAQEEVPTPQQMTQELAEAGAATAAAEVAENIPEEQNPLLSGAIDLSEEQVVEEPPMEEEIIEEQTNIIEEQ
jgi:DNA-nicking Smr family endonuclease